jgi:hypothetical protein
VRYIASKWEIFILSRPQVDTKELSKRSAEKREVNKLNKEQRASIELQRAK